MGVLSEVSNGSKDIIAAFTATAGAFLVMSKFGGKNGTKTKGDGSKGLLRLSAMGIRNLGNTCFMNAILQGLASSKPFIHYLEEIIETVPKSLHNELPFTLALYKCLTQLSAIAVEEGRKPKRNETVNPSELESHIRKQAKQFARLGDQQDSDEFFHLVLDFVEKEVIKWEKSHRMRRGTSSSQHLGLASIASEEQINTMPELPMLASKHENSLKKRLLPSVLRSKSETTVGSDTDPNFSDSEEASDSGDDELEHQTNSTKFDDSNLPVSAASGAPNEEEGDPDMEGPGSENRKAYSWRKSRKGISLFNRPKSDSHVMAATSTDADTPQRAATIASALDIASTTEQEAAATGDSNSYFARVLNGRKRKGKKKPGTKRLFGPKELPPSKESVNSSRFIISSVSPRLGPTPGFSSLPPLPVLNAAIRSPLEGSFLNQLECSRCRIKSPLTSSKYSVLSLAIAAHAGPATGQVQPLRTLHECLKEFTSPEYVDDVQCEHCQKIDGKGRQRARKQMMLGRLPKVLCVHLQRNFFDAKTMMMTKLVNHVECPLILNVSDYCFNSFLSVGTSVGQRGARKASGGSATRHQELLEPLQHVLGGVPRNRVVLSTGRRRRAESAVALVSTPTKAECAQDAKLATSAESGSAEDPLEGGVDSGTRADSAAIDKAHNASFDDKSGTTASLCVPCTTDGNEVTHTVGSGHRISSTSISSSRDSHVGDNPTSPGVSLKSELSSSNGCVLNTDTTVSKTESVDHVKSAFSKSPLNGGRMEKVSKSSPQDLNDKQGEATSGRFIGESMKSTKMGFDLQKESGGNEKQVGASDAIGEIEKQVGASDDIGELEKEDDTSRQNDKKEIPLKLEPIVVHVETEEKKSVEDFPDLPSPVISRKPNRRNTMVVTSVASASSEILYSLYAIIVHQGGANGGHFSTYRRIVASDVPNDGDKVLSPQQWVYASDDLVRPASVDEVMGAKAYMAFYTR